MAQTPGGPSPPAQSPAPSVPQRQPSQQQQQQQPSQQQAQTSKGESAPFGPSSQMLPSQTSQQVAGTDNSFQAKPNGNNPTFPWTNSNDAVSSSASSQPSQPSQPPQPPQPSQSSSSAPTNSAPRKRESTSVWQQPTTPAAQQQQQVQVAAATAAVQAASASSQHWTAAPGGIDLKAEEEALRGGSGNAEPSQGGLEAAGFPSAPGPYSQQQQHQQPNTSRTQPAPNAPSHPHFLHLYPLAQAVYRATSEHGLSDVDPEVLNVISTAAKIRFRNLLQDCVRASRARCWTSHTREPPQWSDDVGESDGDEVMADGTTSGEGSSSKATKRKKRRSRPMYHEDLISDPNRWILAIERADRGEEVKLRRQRREARERAAAIAAAAAAGQPIPTPGTGGEGSERGGSMAPTGSQAQQTDGSGDSAMSSAVGGDDSGLPPAKRPKKDASASMTAKHLSEDIRRRLANNTVNHALGGIGGNMPKWMTMSGGSSNRPSGSSTPLKSFGAPGSKREDGAEEGDNKVDGSDAPGSALPKPRFAPVPGGLNGSAADAKTEGSDASSRPTGLAPSSSFSAGGPHSGNRQALQSWGIDPTLRAAAKEEEMKRLQKRVLLQDALRVLEDELRGGSGAGGNGAGLEKVLMRWRVLGERVGHEEKAEGV